MAIELSTKAKDNIKES